MTATLLAILAASIPIGIGLGIRLAAENDRLTLLSVIATTPLPDEEEE